jgi:hypothetical protein
MFSQGRAERLFNPENGDLDRMNKQDAHEVVMTIQEYEKERDDTMYDGEGKEWISWIVYRLYEHGFIIKEAG